MLTLAACWSCCALAHPAAAQEVQESAQAAYEEGREHYQAGRYREAAESLERAHEADPDAPVLVYNLARVYELLGEYDASIRYYRRYRRMLPRRDPERERASQAIERLEGAREAAEAEAEAEAEAATGDPTASSGRTRGRADNLFYASLIGSGTMLTLATLTGFSALRRDNRSDGYILSTPEERRRYERDQRRARRAAITADLCLGLSAAAGVGAVLLYYLRDAEPEDAEATETTALHVDVQPLRGGAHLTLGGRL